MIADPSHFYEMRIKSIGKYARSIGHRYNNLMSGILGTVTYLLDDEKISEDLKTDLDTILEASEKVNALTKRLSRWGRKLTDSPCEVDLTDCLNRGYDFLQKLIGGDYKLTFQLPDYPMIIWGQPQMVFDLILRMLINLRDMSKKPAPITVNVYKTKLEQTPGRLSNILEKGDYALLSFKSEIDGIIDEDLTTKLTFDPIHPEDYFNSNELGYFSTMDIIDLLRAHFDYSFDNNGYLTIYVFFPLLQSEKKLVPTTKAGIF